MPTRVLTGGAQLRNYLVPNKAQQGTKRHAISLEYDNGMLFSVRIVRHGSIVNNRHVDCHQRRRYSSSAPQKTATASNKADIRVTYFLWQKRRERIPLVPNHAVPVLWITIEQSEKHAPPHTTNTRILSMYYYRTILSGNVL